MAFGGEGISRILRCMIERLKPNDATKSREEKKNEAEGKQKWLSEELHRVKHQSEEKQNQLYLCLTNKESKAINYKFS